MDKFEVCPRCGSNMCYTQVLEDGTETKLCFTCGFTTNSQMKLGSEMEQKVTSNQTQFYKDVRFVDQENLVWYPASLTTSDKGMIYLDVNKDKNGDPVFNWAATPMRELSPKEKRSKKYKGMKYVADTKNTKLFSLNGFMEAAVSLGMFDE